MPDIDDQLAGLPSRVDALERNLTEFRVEVRQEFAAVRSEIGSAIKESERGTNRQMFMLHEDLVQRIHESEEETRRQMRELNGETQRQMRELNGETQRQMRELNDETQRRMRELNDETRRHMHVLHEDLVQRITTIGEGR